MSLQTRQLKFQRLTAQPSLLKRNEILRPFLKWAGGKRQLLPELRRYYPAKKFRYFEPFVGAGAVLFDLQPKKAVINDFNKELINVYQTIKDKPSELLNELRIHQEKNSEEYFYRLRIIDRSKDFENLSLVARAARIIYLNKTCFNGLFRVNSQGFFNVPYGNYENPLIVDEIILKAVSNYLNDNEIQIFNKDFAECLLLAESGDFVYLDPPYHPVSDTSSFTGYNFNNFNESEQIRLKETCDELTRKGCMILQSNSDTPFIRKLYSDETKYKIEIVQANRAINSIASGRGKINEVLISNYDVAHH